MLLFRWLVLGWLR